MDQFDQLLDRLEREADQSCADRRHAAALRDTARVLRAMNDLSEHVIGSLMYPHQPTACQSPQHVELLRDAAEMLSLGMTMVPDGLRYLAATTPEATEAVRTKRMRKLGDLMAESWRRGKPS